MAPHVSANSFSLQVPAGIFACHGFHRGVPPDPGRHLLRPGFETWRSIEVPLRRLSKPASPCALDCPLSSQRQRNRQRSLQNGVDLILWGWFREDDSPMSRRDLSQPSFVDAMVSGDGKVGGLSGPDREGVRLVLVRGFAFADPRLGDRRAGLSAFDDVQDPAPAAMAHAL